MAQKTKIAFIGSGGMAHAHAPGLKKIPGVELVGFCDVSRDKAAAAAAQYGGAAFRDPAKMLDAVEPDGVYVCLPPSAHGAAEMACIACKVPFFVEKPINRTVKQAEEIAAAVKRAKLTTSAGYMNRYRKGVNEVKRLLAKDPAAYVQGGWIGGAPRPAPGDKGIGSWWIRKAKSGGQFIEQVTHTVDLVRYLCGEATRVSAFAAHAFNKDIPGYDIDDALAVALELKSGGVACLYSCCASGATGGVSLQVYAPKTGAIFSGWGHDVTIYRAGKPEQQIAGEGDIFAIEDKAFVKAIRTGDASSIRCSYGDAVETLRITVAADESARTGKPMKLG